MTWWCRYNKKHKILGYLITHLMRHPYRNMYSCTHPQLKSITVNFYCSHARKYIEKLLRTFMIMSNFRTPKRYSFLNYTEARTFS